MIRCSNLAVGYDEPVVEGVSLDVDRGEVVALLGPNGAGKTTLLRTILGLRDPLAGTVAVDGDDICGLSRREVARRLGYVSQEEPRGLPSTVFETVLTGRTPHTSWRPTAEDRAVAADILSQLDLTDIAMRSLAELSGGQRQQVRLARALVQKPDGLVLDEPTSSLDLRHQLTVLERVRQFAIGGAAVLFAMHDVGLAARNADKLIFLAGRSIIERGQPDIVTSELIGSVYGVEADVYTTDGRVVIIPERPLP